MNNLHLSQRLQTVADFVLAHARLADIGSDHAYLPIYLAQQHRIDYGVAGEVVQGPYQLSVDHVHQYGLEQVIKVRLADGLQAIQPTDAINTITIAGMGGTLISNILTAGADRLRGNERLILEPNVSGYLVRQWLADHHYQITHEVILAEDKHVYEVIVGDPATTPVAYSQLDIMFGPFLRREHNAAFVQKWQDELAKQRYILANLQKAQHATTRLNQVKQQIKLIQEVLN